MKHSEAWKMLDGYRDGELSPASYGLVREHLASCPECRNRVSGLERLSSILTSATATRPSESFISGVTVRLAGTGSKDYQPFRWPAPAMAAALAATAFIMIGLLSSPSLETSPSGLIATSFEYEKGGPMPVMMQETEIENHDQVLGSLLEES